MADRMSRIVESRSSTALLTRSATSGRARRRGRLQMQPGGEQPLDHDVVQVPGDALAILEDGKRLPLLLGRGPLQRQCGLTGELSEHRKVLVARSPRAGRPR